MFDETAQTTEAFNVGLEAGREEERKKYIEAMRTMSEALADLEDKYWKANRLISEYDAELKEVKRRVGQLYTENIRLQGKLLGEDTQEEGEKE